MSLDAGSARSQANELWLRDWEAGGYAESYRRAVGAWWDEAEPRLLADAVGARPGLRVLDAGSGVGRVSFALARRGCEVVALDFSGRSLRFLAARARGRGWRIGRVRATLTAPLPLAPGAAHAVVSGQVVQHLPTRDLRVAAWRHLAGVARPGARLATVVYKQYPGEPAEGEFPGGLFFHRYTAAELAAELRAGGWQPTRLRAWYRASWRYLPPRLAAALESLPARLGLWQAPARYLLAEARLAEPPATSAGPADGLRSGSGMPGGQPSL